jgi:hypothetical protein
MASGDTLLIFTAQHNQQPSANGATLDLRNNIPVLDFDAGTDEYAVFSAILPRIYAGGGLTVNCWCMATSATTGDVIMQAAIERGTTDMDSDSFAAAQSSAAVTANGTSGILFNVPVAFTNGAQMDSLAAGEPFRLKINRDANAAGDTMTGDLELVSVEVKET